MGKKTKVLKNIMWVIRSIMEYDEKYLFIVGIVTMIGGILPPLCTIISQKIMNGLQERHYTQEDAWNAAMLCANRQTFDLSVKMPGSVHMSVNYKEQTISVIGSDNQLKRLYKVTTAANQS